METMIYLKWILLLMWSKIQDPKATNEGQNFLRTIERRNLNQT